MKLDGKMACAWQTVGDLRDRLSQCVFLYKGQPLMVGDISPSKVLDLHHPITGMPVASVKYNDEDLDVSSIEVGFWNSDLNNPSENMVAYTTRYPNKTYKQGICNHNLHTEVLGSKQLWHHPSPIKHQGFLDSLVGDFPSVRRVDEFFRAGGKEIAVSQAVALEKTQAGVILVYYRQMEVAWKDPSGRELYVEHDPLMWVAKKLIADLPYPVVVK